MNFSKYALIVLGLINSNVYAITLDEALPHAYKNSDELIIAKETFIGEIQSMSQAISGFLPNVTAQIQMQNAKKDPVNSLTNTNQDTATTQTINVTQPIFNGGSSVANLKAANSQFRASRSKFYDSEQKFIRQAIETYLNLYEAQELYKIASDSVNFRATESKAAEERFKVGVETVTGTALARTKLAQAEAQKAAAFAKLQSLKASFKDMFGIDPVDLEMPKAPSSISDSLESFTSKALSSNFTLDQVKNSADAAKSISYAEAGNLLPSVSLSASASRDTSSRKDLGPSKTLATGLTVNIPILSKGGAEYSAVRKANSAARSASQQLQYTISDISVKSVALWEQYQASKLSLAFSEESVKSSELALQAVKEEYLVGSKTMLDVFQLEDGLNQAKTQDIAIKKLYILNIYDMQSYLGQITAKAMKMNVKYFNPDLEFKKVKAKIVGF